MVYLTQHQKPVLDILHQKIKEAATEAEINNFNEYDDEYYNRIQDTAPQTTIDKLKKAVEDRKEAI